MYGASVYLFLNSQAASISLLLSGVNPNLMFRIFKKKSKKPGELQDVQLRPVEQSGVDPLEKLLRDSRNTIGKRLKALVSGHSDINEDLLEELETALLTADVGVKASLGIMENLRTAINNGSIREPGALLPAVQAELYELIEPCEQFLAVDTSHKPFVILMVGINGAGKTTTIGKLAQRFKEEGLSVMLAAGDTFRAAAVEQLKSWGALNDVPVIAQGTGADSAAVIFDALESAKAREVDILIADTAGRLHTQTNLMEELKKIRRVISRVDENAPHEVMLVVDAGTGTNALNQARHFNEAVNISGITITKLDGTARGGMLFAIASELGIPIRYIGVGEAAKDLRPFDAGTFINAILPLD
jgi:fused signal recognition particle receptor